MNDRTPQRPSIPFTPSDESRIRADLSKVFTPEQVEHRLDSLSRVDDAEKTLERYIKTQQSAIRAYKKDPFAEDKRIKDPVKIAEILQKRNETNFETRLATDPKFRAQIEATESLSTDVGRRWAIYHAIHGQGRRKRGRTRQFAKAA